MCYAMYIPIMWRVYIKDSLMQTMNKYVLGLSRRHQKQDGFSTRKLQYGATAQKQRPHAP